MKPKFLTFTGVDEMAPIAEMQRLAAIYPIEWGVLFSPRRQGQGAYPRLRYIHDMLAPAGLRLAAHLCERDAACVTARSTSYHDPLLRAYFDRVQINSMAPDVDPAAIRAWAGHLHVSPILLCQDALPVNNDVQWLFDSSAGSGTYPGIWPQREPGVLTGYTGSISVTNIEQVIAEVGAVDGEYWLDIQTGVRDEYDEFSVAKCRQLCEVVYGVSPQF